MTIYADNAATTKTSKKAIEAMLPYFDKIYGNPSSLHTVGQEAKEALTQARERIAKCLGAETNEIYFTSGGSEADNQAIVSAAVNGAKKDKKHIISTKFEHHAVLHTLKKLQKQGYEVTYLKVDEKGYINLKELEEAIRPDTILVSIIFVNNEVGTIQDMEAIGKLIKEKNPETLFHTDAVQAVGHASIDVKALDVDMLSASAHKFNGPKGIGFLYIRKGVSIALAASRSTPTG